MSNVKPTYINNNGLPQPVNTATDSVSANAVYVQTSATPDTSVGISRDVSSNLVLTDVVTGSKTLAELAAGGGGGPDAGQREPALARLDYVTQNPTPSLPVQPSPPTFGGTELFVGSSGGEYATVALAVAAASGGDIITIRSGYTSTETGTVTISKPLEIRGEHPTLSVITGPATLLAGLLDIPAGVNNVYIHNCRIWNKQVPASDSNGISACITARTMSATYQSGSSGLYFKSLTLTHPKVGIAVQGNSFVIDDCTFDCNTSSPGVDVRPLVHYGQTGDCFVRDTTFNATSDVRTICTLISAINPGSGSFISGQSGNLVFNNVSGNGTFKAYLVQEVFHQPGARDNATNNYAAGALPNSFSLYFEDYYFPGQYSGNSITFDYNVAATIAAGSNGQTLPQSTIYVATAAAFPASGSFQIRTTAGVETVTYTGRTANTFTGCSGGTGTMATGNSLWELNPLQFFGDIYVKNSTGGSRNAANQKGFITVASSVAITTSNRLVGTPYNGLWVLGTNTFGSVPSGTYGSASTISGLLGYETARYALPSPLLSPTVPQYLPSGAQTVDSVAVNVGDRVMLVQETDPVYSGLYDVASGTWTRVTDMAAGDAASGFYWWVLGGSTYASTQYVVSNVPGSDVVGTNNLAFRRVIVNDDDTMALNVTASSVSLDAASGPMQLTAAGSLNLTSAGSVVVTAGAGQNVQLDSGYQTTISAVTGIGIGATDANAYTINIGTGGSKQVNLGGELLINSDQGTAGQVLTSQGAGLPAVWAAAGGGGLVDWTEALTTTSPNSGLASAASLTAKGSPGADVDAALVPVGNGALITAVADGTASGGNKRGAYAVDLLRVRTAATQIASGTAAVLTGGSYNTASGDSSVVAGGGDNVASAAFSVVSGGGANQATALQATVSGGGSNLAESESSTVGGGFDNNARGEAATVAGGKNNKTDFSNVGAFANTIGGGYGNKTYGDTSTVAGGQSNTAAGSFGTVGGGQNNSALGTYGATVAGGGSNSTGGAGATVGGGGNNAANSAYGTIPGGLNANTREVTGRFSFASSAAVVGKQQTGIHVTRGQTNAGTPGPIYLSVNGSNPGTYAEVNTLPASSTYAIRCLVVARDTAGTSAAWEILGCVKRGAGFVTTAVVGSPIVTSIGADAGAAAWVPVLVAHPSLDAAVIQVVDGSGSPTTVDWVATMYTTEIDL